MLIVLNHSLALNPYSFKKDFDIDKSNYIKQLRPAEEFFVYSAARNIFSQKKIDLNLKKATYSCFISWMINIQLSKKKM